MPKYIDGDFALQCIEEGLKRPSDFENETELAVYEMGLGMARYVITTLPAEDVRPVVRGRWMTKEYMYGDPEAGLADMWVDRPAEETDDYAYCSVCDKDAEYTGEAELVLSDFCPNCGADMRGENER